MNRERILSAARALFAEKGFEGFSMRDLAQQVGMSPSSIYNHFAGKEALYLAVMQSVGEQMHAEVLADIVTDDPLDALRELVYRKAAYLSAHPDVPRLVQWLLLDQSARTHTVVQSIWRVHIDWVLERMSQLVPHAQALSMAHQLFGLLLNEFAFRHALLALPEAEELSFDAEVVAERVWRTLACRIERMSHE